MAYAENFLKHNHDEYFATLLDTVDFFNNGGHYDLKKFVSLLCARQHPFTDNANQLGAFITSVFFNGDNAADDSNIPKIVKFEAVALKEEEDGYYTYPYGYQIIAHFASPFILKVPIKGLVLSQQHPSFQYQLEIQALAFETITVGHGSMHNYKGVGIAKGLITELGSNTTLPLIVPAKQLWHYDRSEVMQNKIIAQRNTQVDAVATIKAYREILLRCSYNNETIDDLPVFLNELVQAIQESASNKGNSISATLDCGFSQCFYYDQYMSNNEEPTNVPAALFVLPLVKMEFIKEDGIKLNNATPDRTLQGAIVSVELSKFGHLLDVTVDDETGDRVRLYGTF